MKRGPKVRPVKPARGRLTPTKKTRLLLAWFGPLAASVIAMREEISVRTVKQFWSDARDAGDLPETSRPHFAEVTPCKSAMAAPASVHGDLTESYDIDADAEAAFAAEVATVNPDGGTIAVPVGDPLLAALQKVHGNDPRREHDDVESMSRDVRRVPSPTMLRSLAAASGNIAALKAMAARSGARA